MSSGRSVLFNDPRRFGFMDLAERGQLDAYPAEGAASEGRDFGGVLVPMVLDAGDGRRLSFLSTTTVFGTPVEVTLSEIAIEAFFPADAETAAALGTAGS